MEIPEPLPGTPAPPFAAKDESGRTWKLSDLQGKPVVLYFYPKDDTPGCTKEACGFRDRMGDVRRHGAVVLGVSRDDAASHKRFKAKFQLDFPLLVDDGSISDAYGTWGEKSMYGRKFMGMKRATFLIGPDGKIVRSWPKVKVDGHVDEVLAALKELKA